MFWKIGPVTFGTPVNHKENMKKLSEGKQLAPDDLAKLSKIKAKIEIVGDYGDMEKVRDVLKQLAKSSA